MVRSQAEKLRNEVVIIRSSIQSILLIMTHCCYRQLDEVDVMGANACPEDLETYSNGPTHDRMSKSLLAFTWTLGVIIRVQT